MKKPNQVGKRESKERQQSPQRPSKPEKRKIPLGENSLLRIAGLLCGVCAVCGLTLGLANLLLEDRIAENQSSGDMGALVEALPYGERYDKVSYSGSDTTVEQVYRADGVGFAIQVSPVGSFSGELTLMVGVNEDGTVAGVAVMASKETEGLGDRVKEPEFREQFAGKAGSVKLEADGGDISAISGATVTSRAVCEAVNSALAAAAELE